MHSTTMKLIIEFNNNEKIIYMSSKLIGTKFQETVGHTENNHSTTNLVDMETQETTSHSEDALSNHATTTLTNVKPSKIVN